MLLDTAGILAIQRDLHQMTLQPDSLQPLAIQNLEIDESWEPTEKRKR